MKKNHILFLFVELLLFLLTGCGVYDREESSMDSSLSGEKTAAASWESTGNQMQTGSFLIKDTHYYQVYERNEENRQIQVSVFRDEHTGSEPELLTTLENANILWYQADAEGNLYMFYQTGEEEQQFFLQRHSNQGALVYKQEIQEKEFRDGDASLNAVLYGAVSAEGEVCLATSGGELYFFSPEGHFVDMTYADWNRETYQGNRCGLVNAGEQGIYTYQIAESGKISLRKVDFAVCTLENTEFFSVGEQSSLGPDSAVVQSSRYISLEIFDGYEMGVLVSDSTGLWQYRPDDREVILLFSWGDSRVSLKDYRIYAIGILPERSFYLLAGHSYEDVAYVKVDYRDVQDLPQKQTVTMGVLSLFSANLEEVEEMVSRFNRQSEICQVELMLYDSIDAFSLELVKGQGPDLIYLYGMDGTVLEEKGVLEELSPYFAASNVVKEDDLLASVRQAGIINGKLVAVIPRYSVSGWLVEKGTTENGGWSVEQFLDLAEANPASLVIDQGESVYKSFILSIALRAELNSYLDGQGGCDFESPEFISLLERIQKLSIPPRVRIDPLDSGYFEADWEYFTEKGYLLKECHLSSLDVSTYSRFNGSLVDGTYAEIAGYPNRDARPVYELDILHEFGINAASVRKDGAWMFLEYLLSAGYQDSLLTFPARVDSFESYLKKDKLYYSELEISQEERELLREMVENARAGWGQSVLQTDIWRIIGEETSPVWAGDCSPEEAARKVQNRVSLYLAE